MQVQKIIYVFLFGALLISCSQKNALRFPKTIPDFIKVNTTDLRGKVFSIGPQLDSVKMEIVADCDCCLSYLAFIDDSLFLYESLCLEGDDYFSGTYSHIGKLIVLKFDPLITSEVHYPGTDLTSTWETKNSPVHYSALNLSILNSEPVISASYGEDTEYGLIDKSTSSVEFTRYLKQIGAWKRLRLPY